MTGEEQNPAAPNTADGTQTALRRAVKLPARSPDLNAYAERFVRSIKSECLAQIIPLASVTFAKP